LVPNPADWADGALAALAVSRFETPGARQKGVKKIGTVRGSLFFVLGSCSGSGFPNRTQNTNREPGTQKSER
jgi:hypothetical protein